MPFSAMADFRALRGASGVMCMIILTQKTEEYPGKSYTNHSTLTKGVPSSDMFSYVKCDVNIKKGDTNVKMWETKTQDRTDDKLGLQAGFTRKVYTKGITRRVYEKGLTPLPLHQS